MADSVEEPWSGKSSMDIIIMQFICVILGPVTSCHWCIQAYILVKGNSVFEGASWPQTLYSVYIQDLT